MFCEKRRNANADRMRLKSKLSVDAFIPAGFEGLSTFLPSADWNNYLRQSIHSE